LSGDRIALINAVGSVGGYLGSSLMGYFKDATGNYRSGLSLLALSMLLAGVLALAIGRPKGVAVDEVSPSKAFKKSIDE
jgi:cyanate permease